MMVRQGFKGIIVYLDDFLIVEKSYDTYLEVQNRLISLLWVLMFSIAWEKIEGLTHSLVF